MTSDTTTLKELAYELRHQAHVIEMSDNMAASNGMIKVAQRLQKQAHAVDRAIATIEGAEDG